MSYYVMLYRYIGSLYRGPVSNSYPLPSNWAGEIARYTKVRFVFIRLIYNRMKPFDVSLMFRHLESVIASALNSGVR